MTDQPIYVDKRHYDVLFNSFSKVKEENAVLKENWEMLKKTTRQFDDRVLIDIHQFESLQEENAYLTGAFNAMMAIRCTINKLEETNHVQTRN